MRNPNRVTGVQVDVKFITRSFPWSRRPQASRLLDDLAHHGRGFEAVVIGEPQRAFYGNQFGLTFPVFVHYGVALWVPEVGGPVDPGSDAHEIVMSLYGRMSKGERNRIKVRVRSAMATQASTEGSFLGGRPPYGYRLGDAGPHPNPSKAATGQRLHRLEIDPLAASIVRRIFREFLRGDGLYAIAEGLTRDGIPSPSAHDPGRNRHRSGSGGAWSKLAVPTILKNPRYTGHQVWNRQPRNEVLVDVNDVVLGHQTKQRWSRVDQWIWSERPSHQPVIDMATFGAAQQVFVQSQRPAQRRSRTKHNCLLSGLVLCALCGRRMQASWNHGRPYYRCKCPAEYALTEQHHAKAVYVRETGLVSTLDGWLGELFDGEYIDDTCGALAQASEATADDEAARKADLRRRHQECNAKLAKYQTASAK